MIYYVYIYPYQFATYNVLCVYIPVPIFTITIRRGRVICRRPCRHSLFLIFFLFDAAMCIVKEHVAIHCFKCISPSLCE